MRRPGGEKVTVSAGSEEPWSMTTTLTVGIAQVRRLSQKDGVRVRPRNRLFKNGELRGLGGVVEFTGRKG